MLRTAITGWFISLICGAAIAAEWKLADMKSQANDQTVFHAKPVDEKERNAVSSEYEREFQKRARAIISAQAELRARGTTYFESEKRFYGFLMAHVLSNDAEKSAAALNVLQAEDAQAKDWHNHTEGIDYFPSFTLKHQMRKYFYFGDLLEPEYKKRMYRGAKKWTEKDPLNRPHHAFAKATGWGPNAKNSWVDVRNTENLFLMRVTSVYLMAEETGNKQTTALYKEIILNYAHTLYRVGIGEWDSENYHGHSLAPLCNLYDFAQDNEVKRAAKACLDFFMAAGAVKYFRGGFNGPGSRDYNHSQPFGGSAAANLWVYFGDTKQIPKAWESDEVHFITSAYRPPAAVANLARKQFKRPVEIFSSKPNYTSTTTFDTDSTPAYLETQYIGNTFQLGSLGCGTPPGVSSVNGFKIIAADSRAGSLLLQAAPTGDPDFVGSPLYKEGKITAQNRVAQYGNTAIWLAKDGKSPWLWVVPNSVRITHNGSSTFLQCDETWVAITPLNASRFEKDSKQTELATQGKTARFTNHVVISSRGTGKAFSGFAVEIGEKQSHKSFAEFQKLVLQSEIDVSKIEDGVATYKSPTGKHLGFHWNDDPKNLGVWRNGQRHNWKEHAAWLYRAGDGNTTPPIAARWGAGRLVVNAGGETFENEVK